MIRRQHLDGGFSLRWGTVLRKQNAYSEHRVSGPAETPIEQRRNETIAEPNGSASMVRLRFALLLIWGKRCVFKFLDYSFSR
jgi:hypothetical protein